LYEAQLQAARDAISQQMFDPANVDGIGSPDGTDWASLIAGLLGNGGDGSSGPSGSDNTGGNGRPKVAPKPKPIQANPLQRPKPAPRPRPIQANPMQRPAPAKKKGGK
jgi:hypothetical protein